MGPRGASWRYSGRQQQGTDTILLKKNHGPAKKPPNRLCMTARCMPPLVSSLARYRDLPATRLRPCSKRRKWKSHLGGLDSTGNRKNKAIRIDGDASRVRRARKNNATTIMSTVPNLAVVPRNQRKFGRKLFRLREIGVERDTSSARTIGVHLPSEPPSGLRKAASTLQDIEMRCKEAQEKRCTPPRRLHAGPGGKGDGAAGIWPPGRYIRRMKRKEKKCIAETVSESTAASLGTPEVYVHIRRLGSSAAMGTASLGNRTTAATILDVEAGSRTIYHAWVSDFAGQFRVSFCRSMACQMPRRTFRSLESMQASSCASGIVDALS